MALTIQTGSVRSLQEYVATGNARTHRSDAGSQAEVDPAVLAPLSERLRQDGFAVLPGLYEPAGLDRLRRELAPHFRDGGGRNPFEGLRTRRIYGLVEKAPSAHPLAEHPLVLGLLDRVLEPNYLLSQLQAIEILPGEAAQPLHHDDGFYPVPRPRPPLGAATILALDDFTAENGATRVIPGSHLWDGREPSPDEAAAALPVTMPAGAAVIFLGTLWHGGGANDSPRPRLALTAQYCAPWCRQQENYSLSVSRRTARTCSPHLQRLLGYSVHAPFMGMVDGVHPRRLLLD